MKMLPQIFIIDIWWLHAHEHQLGLRDLYDGLEPSEQDFQSLTWGTQGKEIRPRLAGHLMNKRPVNMLGHIDRAAKHLLAWHTLREL
jgi:hypothetical protein